jgi:hypothetical protein
MVQKGKVEETILESVPQLIIQIVNIALLNQQQGSQADDVSVLAIFSISLSVMSLTSTVWYCPHP